MTLEVSEDKLVRLLSKQLNHMFVFDYESELKILKESIDFSLDKCNFNFKYNNNKYFTGGGVNPFNSVQYMIFLYYISSFLYKNDDNDSLASRVYYLNKMLNGVDLFYAIELPDIFSAEHPVGAVMGRAKYSNRFFFYQNTTVGGNKNKYPHIGENVVLFANATVIGDSEIGNNCIVSACSYIKDERVPDYTIVYGQSPNLIYKQRRDIIDNVIKTIFVT